MRTWPDGTRLNGDVFLRYYLGGQAFHGIALGLKVGPTRQSTGATHLGVGFDINQTLPVGDLVFISTGFGVKRLIGAKVDVVDNGVQYGGSAFTQPGYGGVRTDFMDVAFDNYLAKNLP